MDELLLTVTAVKKNKFKKNIISTIWRFIKSCGTLAGSVLALRQGSIVFWQIKLHGEYLKKNFFLEQTINCRCQSEISNEFIRTDYIIVCYEFRLY